MSTWLTAQSSAAAQRRRRGALLACVAWLAATLYAVCLPIVVHVSGATLVTLVSCSMSPTYPVGSVLLMHKSSAQQQIRVGDIITVARGNGLPVTHRVVEVVNLGSATAYRTKGDANRDADAELVMPAAVVGRIDGPLPTWLSGALWLHGGWQRALLFGLPLLLIAVGEFRLLRAFSKERNP